MESFQPDNEYTINAFNNVVCLTVSSGGGKGGITPGSPVITSFLDSPGKGGGPTTEQIWQPTYVNDSSAYFTNPESGLVLAVDDGGNVIVDVPPSPKDPSGQTLWTPTFDDSSGAVFMVFQSSGQVITMPGGQSNVQVVVDNQASEGDPERQYQLWQGGPVQQSSS